MLAVARLMAMESILRYAKAVSPDVESIDGLPNFHHATRAQNGTRALLESGINAIREVHAVDGPRRPAILLRSSPWKAGHVTNPWHDIFDLDHGYVRYYGDHKPSQNVGVADSRGNALLVGTFARHQGNDEAERLQAAPILLFRSVTVQGVVKGHVQFCGVALIESLGHVVQRDTATGESFPNLVFDLTVLSLAAEGERLDWRWIDDRRNPTISTDRTLEHAPGAWKQWVRYGPARLPQLRRRVISSRIRATAAQTPAVGSKDEAILRELYIHFEGRKHAFELLASRIAGHVLGDRGATYREGWITRGSGDGGADFIARLEVGDGQCTVPIVVLGQAKCVSPESSISAEHLARVVARLRRGWIGVYVTTGVISRPAQLEMVDDQYPILLISGRDLAIYAQRLAQEAHGGNPVSYTHLTLPTTPYV